MAPCLGYLKFSASNDKRLQGKCLRPFLLNFQSVQKTCSSKVSKEQPAFQCCSWGPRPVFLCRVSQSISNSFSISTGKFPQICRPPLQLQESHKNQSKTKMKCAG